MDRFIREFEKVAGQRRWATSTPPDFAASDDESEVLFRSFRPFGQVRGVSHGTRDFHRVWSPSSPHKHDSDSNIQQPVIAVTIAH